MSDKVFVVTHARARAPITVTGRTLEEALEKEGLDPNIWKLMEEPPLVVVEPEPEPESPDTSE